MVCLLGVRDGRSQAPGDVDLGFQNPRVFTKADVYTTVVQKDGKVIVTGAFSFMNGVPCRGIARLNADGSLDAGFSSREIDVGGTIYFMIVQADGKILLGGSFTYVNGVARNSVARLNADGSLDTSFVPGTGASTVLSIAQQPDGKVIIGGTFDAINGTARNRVARLNADGGLDTGFVPGTAPGTIVNSVAVQANGKVIVGGYVPGTTGGSRGNVARLNADGSFDAGFVADTGDGSEVLSVAIQPDGKVLVGGYYNFMNGVARNRIARLNTDSSLDTGFDPGTGASDTVRSVALQPDGKIVIGGSFYNVNGVSHPGTARLNANGGLDTTFSTAAGIYGSVNSVAVQADGKLVVGGRFDSAGGVARGGLARLSATGGLDAGFDPGSGVNGIGTVYAVTPQTDGKIIIGGTFDFVNGASRNGIARLNADGSLDAGFVPDGSLYVTYRLGRSGSVNTVVVRPDGKIVIGGYFQSSSGTAAYNSVARLNADGSLDKGFKSGEGADDFVYAAAVQPDGKVVLGGSFSSFNRTAYSKVVRLNADGSVDTTFNQRGPDNTVYSVALQPDGKIVIGGAFTRVFLPTRKGVARLNGDGSLDTGFAPATQVGSVVYAAKVQPDGKIVAIGNILVKLNPDGTFDPVSRPFPAGATRSFAVQANGRTIIGNYYNVSRLNADFSSDAQFNKADTGYGSGPVGIGTVYSLALQPDGKILAGGSFATVNGVVRVGVVRLYGGPFEPTVMSSLTASGQIGAAFTYQVTADNNPTSYSADGLPRGLTINSADGSISGSPEQAGTFQVKLSAVNSYGAGTKTLVLSISDTFSNWQRSNFTPAELANPGVSGLLGDATGAGVTNLVKYALAIPPKRPGVAGMPTVLVQKDNYFSYLLFTYTHNKLAPDVKLTVQVSEDLIAWNTSGTELGRTDNGDGTETVVVRDTAASTTGVRRFMRLQVTVP